MPVSDDMLFEQRFAYHHQLEARRWQYFAAFLLLNSILFGALKDMKEAGPMFQIPLPANRRQWDG
jgi:hypothetical protein